MHLNVPFQACFIALAIALLSGSSDHARADDLALEAADKKPAASKANPADDRKKADDGESKDEAKGDEFDSSGRIDPLMLIRELNALRIKRAKYAQNLGSGHPTIVGLTEQIQEVEAELKDAPEPSDPLAKKVENIEDLSEKELRKAVAMLISRVRDLEYDLQAMQREVNVIRQRR